MLSDHIRYITRMINAFLDNYTLGTLIIENGQVFLELEIGELIQLNDSFIIEVFDGQKYHTITYEQALNTYCADMPDCLLFAGFECRVKRKAAA